MQEQSLEKSNDVTPQELLKKLKDWTSYLKKKWKLIFLVFIIGAAGGFIWGTFQKTKYDAKLTFAMEDDGSGGGGMSGALGLANQFGLDLGGSSAGMFNSANIIELMKSRSLIEKTLLQKVRIDGVNDSISLADFYLRIQAGNDGKTPLKVQFPSSLRTDNFTKQQDSLLGAIYKDILNDKLRVAPLDKKTSIVVLNFLSENELFAKFFLEILASETSAFYVETKVGKASANVAVLQRQTDSVRTILNSAIGGVAVAIDNTFNLNPALNSKRAYSQTRQIDVQTNSAILVELVKNLELAKMTLRKETPLIHIIDVPILPLEKLRTSRMILTLSAGMVCAFLLLIGLIISRVLKLNN